MKRVLKIIKYFFPISQFAQTYLHSWIYSVQWFVLPLFFLLPVVAQVSIFSPQLKLDQLVTVNLVKVEAVGVHSSGDAGGQLEQDVAPWRVGIFAGPNVKCHLLWQQIVAVSLNQCFPNKVPGNPQLSIYLWVRLFWNVSIGFVLD